MLTLQKVSQVAVKGSIVNVGEPKMKAMNKAICLAGELQNIAEPNIRTHLSPAIPAVQPKGILKIHFEKSPGKISVLVSTEESVKFSGFSQFLVFSKTEIRIND